MPAYSFAKVLSGNLWNIGSFWLYSAVSPRALREQDHFRWQLYESRMAFVESSTKARSQQNPSPPSFTHEQFTILISGTFHELGYKCSDLMKSRVVNLHWNKFDPQSMCALVCSFSPKQVWQGISIIMFWDRDIFGGLHLAQERVLCFQASKTRL